jgi:uncharacterized protein YcnI
MIRTLPRRHTVTAGLVAGLMVAAALPVQAVNIPEGGAVTPGSSYLFHLRVTSTCDGLPMDELEVTIPESVVNSVPEAVPGWDVMIEAPEEMDEEAAEGDESAEAEAEAAKGDEEVAPTVVRWSGGLLEDGYLLDFGIRARFPDEEGEVLEFPVVQRCGEEELESAPTVTLAKRYGNGDIAEMSATIDQLAGDVEVLRADVDQLQKQVGEVNVENLRSRVGDNEKAVKDLDERVTAIEEGEPAPEPLPEEESEG